MLIYNKQYGEAARLAIRVDRPRECLKAFESVDDMQAVVGGLEDAEVTKVLGWARDWNTRSRNSAVAQGVFNAAVRTRGATAVLDLAGEELILAMEAYSERHLERIEKLIRGAHVLEWLSDSLPDVVMDDADDGTADNAALYGMDVREVKEDIFKKIAGDEEIKGKLENGIWVVGEREDEDEEFK